MISRARACAYVCQGKGRPRWVPDARTARLQCLFLVTYTWHPWSSCGCNIGEPQDRIPELFKHGSDTNIRYRALTGFRYRRTSGTDRQSEIVAAINGPIPCCGSRGEKAQCYRVRGERAGGALCKDTRAVREP